MTTILQDLSREQLIALVLKQRQENGTGNGIKVRKLGERYTDGKGNTVIGKGNVSVYGIQRFPVTFYPQQWLKLLGMADQIKTTIADNKASLSWSKDGDE